MLQIAYLQLLRLYVNLHIPVSHKLLLIVLIEKTAGVPRTDFEVVSQHQNLHVYIDNFLLAADIIDST